MSFKICDCQIKNECYKKFKNILCNGDVSKKDILKEMLNYVEYYAWLKFDYCPENTKIERIIKLLNISDAEELYPMILFLFGKFFPKDESLQNPEELSKILNLLCDFLVRVRVCGFCSNTGLREALMRLLKGFKNGEIKCDYETLLFELSNSYTNATRFPDNKEFLEALNKSVDLKYAKILLLKTEEKETKIPLNTTYIDNTTVSYLLPEKLSNEWILSFNTKEEAEKIVNDNLKKIGNIILVSKKDDLKKTKNIWKTKRNLLYLSPYLTTKDVAKYESWKQDDIKNRSMEIAEKICYTITEPLPRTRCNKDLKFTEGFIRLDDPDPVKNIKIDFVLYNRVEHEVKHWNNLLLVVCRILFKHEREAFLNIIQNNEIHKKTSNKRTGLKDPIIVLEKQKSLLNKPIELDNTGIFIEGALITKSIKEHTKKLVEKCGLLDWFFLKIE